MKLRLDLAGIIVQLQIRKYDPELKGDYCTGWCKTDFSFSSEPWLNYAQDDAEVFLSSEVADLYTALNQLLQDELTEEKMFECIEPDFNFILQPKFDVRNNPKVLYVKPGHEIVDITMEWTVSFWNEGLTANYLSVSLNREEIQHLCNYLGLVTGQLREADTVILNMINAGVLI